ncbi:MAG TPA: zf-HC2 domain-containing protein [Solirubrobacteraceae bacterium]|nr:zf-HC2 domain-containing protein [Solirubrobacteraceae bacterium]
MSEGQPAGVTPGTASLTISAAQRRAAHAYATVLLEPDVAGPAAEDALDAFASAVAERPELSAGSNAVSVNETLLALTRLMTAVSVPDRSRPEDRRRAVWASIGASSHCTCRESAALLATRANGNIQPREDAALEEHLAGCAGCRELADATTAAEQAFRAELTPPGRGGFGLPDLPRTAYAILALLIAVAVALVALNGNAARPAAHTALAPAPPTVTHLVVDVNPTTRTAARRDRHLAARHRVVRHRSHHAHPRRGRASTAAPSTGPGTAATSESTAASSSATSTPVSATASAPVSQPAAATASAPAPSPQPAASAQPAASDNLPAQSAPQQGIGTITSSQ